MSQNYKNCLDTGRKDKKEGGVQCSQTSRNKIKHEKFVFAAINSHVVRQEKKRKTEPSKRTDRTQIVRPKEKPKRDLLNFQTCSIYGV